MVALKDELAHKSTAVIWVAHRFSHQERVLDLGVVRQAQVTENVVKGVFQTLQVINHVFIEHGPAGNLARLKLTDLVPDQVHRVDLPIYGSLWLGYLVAET